MGTLILSGGLSPKNLSTSNTELKFIKSVNKTTIKVLIVNFASGKKSVIQKVIDGFSQIQGVSFEFGILDEIILDENRGNIGIEELIKKFDICYISGGSPVRLINKLNKFELFPVIFHEFFHGGKILLGNSAGAVIFFEKFITSVDKKIGERIEYIPKVRKGYAVILGLVAAHFTNWNRQEIVKSFSHKHKIDALGIDEGAAVVIDSEGNIQYVSSNFGKCWKYEYKTQELQECKKYN